MWRSTFVHRLSHQSAVAFSTSSLAGLSQAFVRALIVVLLDTVGACVGDGGLPRVARAGARARWKRVASVWRETSPAPQGVRGARQGGAMPGRRTRPAPTRGARGAADERGGGQSCAASRGHCGV